MTDSTPMTRRQVACATALGALAVALPVLAEAKPLPSNLAPLQALVDQHNKAFTAQDLNGVLAAFSPKAILMGTVPGEMWTGHAEISDAYRHYFQDFDKGKQSFENLFAHGRIVGGAAWMVGVSKVTMHKSGKKTEFGANFSLAFEQVGGKWLIQSMHVSNKTAAAKG